MNVRRLQRPCHLPLDHTSETDTMTDNDDVPKRRPFHRSPWMVLVVVVVAALGSYGIRTYKHSFWMSHGANDVYVNWHCSVTSLTFTGHPTVDIERLKGLPRLEYLTLFDCDITDAALVHLNAMTRLAHLNLSLNPITDAGLVHLQDLTHLQELHLHKTQVTDAGLDHLKRLTNLRILTLSGTTVTDEGVTKLRQTLPDCTVSHRRP